MHTGSGRRMWISAALIAVVCVFAASAKEIRVGIVGLDTGHPLLFTETVNVKKPPVAKGFRVTAAYQWGSRDIVTSTNRYPANIAKMKSWGVEIVPTIAELLSKCDAVMLETSDGREHLKQALEIFAAGKPVYIDKPFAASLEDVVRIIDAGKAAGAKFFATSALRYMSGCQKARSGEMGPVRGAMVWSQEAFEPNHSDFFWYAIHGAEPLFTIMGRGCERVTCMSGPHGDTLTGLWRDGRQGVLHGMRWTIPGSGYGAVVFTATKKGAVRIGGYSFDALSAEIMKFFRTGVVPVDPQETLEIYAFLEAAAQSKRKGGAPVAIADVLAEARRAANGDDAAEGWDNKGSGRRMLAPRKALWRAPLEKGMDAFAVSMRDGAEGSVCCTGGVLVVKKTNSKGRIVVTAREPFVSDKPRRLRLASKFECADALPMASYATVALDSGRGAGKALERSQWGGGRPRNTVAVNTAPGVPEWKYALAETSVSNGMKATASVVVSGMPCTTSWRDMSIEDYDEVQKGWRWLSAKRTVRDRRGGMIPEKEFDKALAADSDHTARIGMRGGNPVLLVDGKPVPPVVYKSVPPDIYRRMKNMHGGGALESAGVTIQSATVVFGRCHRYPNGRWTRDGFDVAGAAADLKEHMRLAPRSLFIVEFYLDPYQEFTADHPEEIWRGRNGEIVYGSPCSVRGVVRPGEPIPGRNYPMPSMSSRVWRSEVKKAAAAFIAEFKRQGLAKRIIGVHLAGFEDAQFGTSNWPDFSECALKEFRRRTGNPKAVIPDYPSDPAAVFDPVKDADRIAWQDFIQREPCVVLNDIARHIKKCFGKDIVTLRWCIAAFSGQYSSSYDIGEFTESDSIDILVAQAMYGNRGPSLPLGCKIPLVSFRKHRKMFLYEFDFRTWCAFDSCMNSEISVMGLGCMTDLPMWKAGYRRAAGLMFAEGMGFWLFDMAGGWFDDSGIAADIADSLAVFRQTAAAPGTGWKPSAALVIDEREMFRRNLLRPIPGKAHVWRPEGSADVNDHSDKLTASGVPYDVWLAEDLLKDPSLADGYKAIAWACVAGVDRRRSAFLRRFRGHGGKVLFPSDFASMTAETFNRFVRDAGGYVPIDRAGLQVNMNGGFLSLHCLVPGKYDFALPAGVRKVVNLKTGREYATSGGRLPLEMVAGETRWYRLVR